MQKSNQMIQLLEQLGLEYIILTTSQSCISIKHQELYKQITKATALVDVCNLIQIPIADTIVLGDDLNDLDMFHAAGHCIAMGNAVNELKEIADEITLSVSEDGAAFSLKQLFHI